MIASGRLASVRIGRVMRVAPEDLTAYIAGLKDSPPSRPSGGVTS